MNRAPRCGVAVLFISKLEIMKKNFKSGFTLIELLVVVAIIGILASVVLASLNSARAKGTDAAIKSAVSNARAQAELYYDSGQSYAGVCTLTGGVLPLITNAAQKLLSTNAPTSAAFTYSATGATDSAVCHDAAGAWAAIVSLKNPTTTSAGWCVDSTGAAKEATALGAGVTVCP